MKEKTLDELIRQKKNEYFRNYYKEHKERVLETQRRYWEKKLREENKL